VKPLLEMRVEPVARVMPELPEIEKNKIGFRLVA
jgi:hypothetical protein